MNSKLLMTFSSLVLGAAGVLVMFLPDLVLSMQGVEVTNSASILVQMLGAFYFAFAMMNWTAKDSAIGGIYARPVSLANFSHFFTGTLLLVKYSIQNFSLPVMAVTIVYIFFSVCFYWLVFRATGLDQ